MEVNMFFKKKTAQSYQLTEYVSKKNNTGYVFINIADDLGDAVELGVDKWPPVVLMAYAYARRAAMAALLIQGIVKPDVYEHVKVVFKGIQAKTGQTVEFQEDAFKIAVNFMASYAPAITTLLIKQIIHIAENYEINSGVISDENLFKMVIETAYEEGKIEKTKPKPVENPIEYTCSMEPVIEVQTELGLKKYMSKVSTYSKHDLYTEFANVLAAKFNVMNYSTRSDKQTLVSDLNDKVSIICCVEFGKERFFKAFGSNPRGFNELVMKIDGTLAGRNLDKESHGRAVIDSLRNMIL
jgi:hypothetical protein